MPQLSPQLAPFTANCSLLTAKMNIHYLGIRHHGPGCARNLNAALKKIKPDIVLIEMPADINSELAQPANPKLKPPVALLIYNPENPKAASFYPFAEFSPEWQTMLFCQKNNIPIRGFDLPKNHWLALGEKENMLVEDIEDSGNVGEESEEETEKTIIVPVENEIEIPQTAQIRRDPLGYMAELAGYTDGERWWEAVMEKQGNDVKLFDAILELMTTLRTELNMPESEETYLREAYMRKTLREAVAEGFQQIAIVCGAWHTPALSAYNTTEKEDTQLLKGLPKIKTIGTAWVPWTYNRLSSQSGYGAGIVSPAWYEMLYKKPRKDILTFWMTRAAHLLRKEDLDASSAHIIEAVRLTTALATMRDLHLAGMDEMLEAATSIFGGGYSDAIKIIEKELVIGDKMGDVPKELKNNPFQLDLEKAQKKLEKKGKFKVTEKKEKLALELRIEIDLNRSILLNRLNILNITWGKYKEGNSSNDRLSSHEIWDLEWKPEFAINVVEAGMWGNTVLDAVTNFAISRANDSNDMVELVKLLKECFNAAVNPAISPIIYKIQDIAAVSKDILVLMDTLPYFVERLRYSGADFRKSDADIIHHLLEEIIPRICVSLPTVCSSLDADAANDIWGRMQKANQAIVTLNWQHQTQNWFVAIQSILTTAHIDGLLSGGSCRLLFDNQRLNKDDTEMQLSRALSGGNEPMFSVRWMQGYLSGSAMILITNHTILALIDNWLRTLSNEIFVEYAPLMRKVFSKFSPPERQKILQLAANVDNLPKTGATGNMQVATYNEARAKQMQQAVNEMFKKIINEK